MFLLELAEPPEHLFGADLVDKSERTAAERREAKTEDGTDIAITRAAKDDFAEATTGLVHKLSAHRQAMSSLETLLLVGSTPRTAYTDSSTPFFLPP